MSAEWYYIKDGQKQGPVTAAELKSLARSGKLFLTDMVLKSGVNGWRPASVVKGLFDTQPASPPMSQALDAPLAVATEASDWYYTKDGQKQGPVFTAKLRALAQDGKLSPTDLLWTSGMTEWKNASDIKGLFDTQISPTPVAQASEMPTKNTESNQEFKNFIKGRWLWVGRAKLSVRKIFSGDKRLRIGLCVASFLIVGVIITIFVMSFNHYRLTENYVPHIKDRIRNYDRIDGQSKARYRLTEKGNGNTLRETPFAEPVMEKRVVRDGFVEVEGASSITRYVKIGAVIGDSWPSKNGKTKCVYETSTVVSNVRCATIKIYPVDGNFVNTAVLANGIGLVYFYSEVKRSEGKWGKTGEVIYDEWRLMNKTN